MPNFYKEVIITWVYLTLPLFSFCEEIVELNIPSSSSFRTKKISVDSKIIKELSRENKGVEIVATYNSGTWLQVRFSEIKSGYYSFTVPGNDVEFRIYSGKVEYFYKDQFLIGLPSSTDDILINFSELSNDVRVRVQLIAASSDSPISNDILWKFSHFTFKAEDINEASRKCKFRISTSSDFSGKFDGFFVPVLK